MLRDLEIEKAKSDEQKKACKAQLKKAAEAARGILKLQKKDEEGGDEDSISSSDSEAELPQKTQDEEAEAAAYKKSQAERDGKNKR